MRTPVVPAPGVIVILPAPMATCILSGDGGTYWCTRALAAFISAVISSFLCSTTLAFSLPWRRPPCASGSAGAERGVFWTLPSGPYRQDWRFVFLTSPLRLTSVFSIHV